MMVLKDDPVPPRRLNRRLARDLETICLKCLRKEPGRRYASAADLADDLDNWLAGRPINARPVGAAERLWRWAWRNPVPASAAAAVLLVAALAFVLIYDSRNDALALAQEKSELADTNGTLAATNLRLANEKTIEATRATNEATRARDEEKKARREAMRLAFQQATALSDQGEVGRAMHVLAHGVVLAEQAEERDLERLFRANLAAWRCRFARAAPPVTAPGRRRRGGLEPRWPNPGHRLLGQDDAPMGHEIGQAARRTDQARRMDLGACVQPRRHDSADGRVAQGRRLADRNG